MRVGREQGTGHPSPKSKLLVSEGCLLFWCTCAQEFSESIGNEIVCRVLFGTVNIQNFKLEQFDDANALVNILSCNLLQMCAHPLFNFEVIFC